LPFILAASNALRAKKTLTPAPVMRERAVALGWPIERIHTIDNDLGISGCRLETFGNSGVSQCDSRVLAVDSSKMSRVTPPNGTVLVDNSSGQSRQQSGRARLLRRRAGYGHIRPGPHGDRAVRVRTKEAGHESSAIR
jgi:hypothetical protein